MAMTEPGEALQFECFCSRNTISQTKIKEYTVESGVEHHE